MDHMKTPFKLTDAMAMEIEDAARNGQEPHDPIGTGSGHKSLRRRTLTLQDFGGPMPGPENDTKTNTSVPEDAINPGHYRKHPSGVECIEITEWMTFNVGNAVKYIWRHMDKGDPVENLKKAQWYLDREILRLTRVPK